MPKFTKAMSNLDDSVKEIDQETLQVPKERISTPEALRGMFVKFREDDTDSAENRTIIQEMKDFAPPHDDEELEDKGQGDRFNITSGEGPALINEAVSAYMDIHEKPRTLLTLPLLPEIGENAEDWGQIMAEEFTSYIRSQDTSLPYFLQLADKYVTHGVAITYFDDPWSVQYKVGGLDTFKFPRKAGIVSSRQNIVVCSDFMDIVDLYGKISGGAAPGWDENMVKRVISLHAGKKKPEWNDFEEVQREIKANDLYVSSICEPIKIIWGWVREYNGTWSLYMTTEEAVKDASSEKEVFLFRRPSFYENVERAFQIFAFSVGNGGRLYTVRGLGYLIFQLCNAMDIMNCQMLNAAVTQSSLIVQPNTTDDMKDMQIINFGYGLAIPPSCRIPERPVSANLLNTLIPAIRENREVLNHVTGGLTAGGAINEEGDRKTKLEISAKLDFLNKLNSFAVSLFYPSYENILKEQVRRAFTVRQRDPIQKAAIDRMMKRCEERGVDKSAFEKIDFSRIRCHRLLGNGSMASRIGLMDQVQPFYSAWDDVGRKKFDHDYVSDVLGYDKADEYAGKLTQKREPLDASIAVIENEFLIEGHYIEPRDGQMHMVHIPIHLEELEVGLQGVDDGTVDLRDWTMQHYQLYKHVSATIEMTTVHESMQATLNQYNQRAQQIGEIANNGMRMINKEARENAQAQMEEQAQAQAQGMQQQVGPDGQPIQQVDPVQAAKVQLIKQEQAQKDIAFKMKISQEVQLHLARLKVMNETGKNKMVLDTQKAMVEIETQRARNAALLQRTRERNEAMSKRK